MKLRVLGSADMNSVYFSASYLIDERYLIDIPEGLCRRMKQLGLPGEAVEAVLITHLHGDHILGLPVWALLQSKRVAPPDGSIRICATPSQKASLEHLIQSSFAGSFPPEKTDRLFCWSCDPQFTVGSLTVERIPVTHGNLPDCFGYLLRDGRVTVGFTGDCCLCDGVRRILAAADYAVCDCDLTSGNSKHMGIDDLEALSEEFPQVRIFASHMKDETREFLLQKKQKNVTPLCDGDVLVL